MNPRVLMRSMILLLITMTGILVFWSLYRPTPTGFPEVPTLEEGDNPYASLFIPSFTLTDRFGETVDESWLDGQYTVMDFFYTSCPLICPGMSAAMREVQNATEGTGLRLLSVSIDPEVDTPEVISRYANGFKADPQRWKYATGDIEMVTIMLMGVQFNVGDLSMKDGFRNIDHPSSLILVGPDRHVIKLYNYQDPEQMRALIEKARELAG